MSSTDHSNMTCLDPYCLVLLVLLNDLLLTNVQLATFAQQQQQQQQQQQNPDRQPNLQLLNTWIHVIQLYQLNHFVKQLTACSVNH